MTVKTLKYHNETLLFSVHEQIAVMEFKQPMSVYNVIC